MSKAVSLVAVFKEELSVAFKLLCILLKMRQRACITGSSMTPAFFPGEEVLYDPKAYQRRLPEVGDVVVAIHPNTTQKIIKRVTSVLEDGSCFLTGDNQEASTDSRSFGFVSLKHILGKVICKFP